MAKANSSKTSISKKFDNYYVAMPIFALEDIGNTMIRTGRCPYRSAVTLDTIVQGLALIIGGQLPALEASPKAKPFVAQAWRTLDELESLINLMGQNDRITLPLATGLAIKALTKVLGDHINAAAKEAGTETVEFDISI